MRKLFILFLMYAGQVAAQHTFYKALDFDFNNYLVGSVETKDAFFFCGYDKRISEIGDNLLLVKINKAGDLIWEKRFDFEYNSRYYSILDAGDGFFVGGIRKNEDELFKLIAKFDYNGNQLWEKTYSTPIEYPSGQTLASLTDHQGGLLVSGAIYNPISETQDAQLIHMDEEGNILWTKNYGLDDGVEKYNDYFVKTIPTNNAIYAVYTSVRWSDESYFCTLIKTDLIGNELWRKEVRSYTSIKSPELGTSIYNTFTILNNGNVLMYFVKYHPDEYLSTNRFVEFNSAGEEVNVVQLAYSFPIAPLPASEISVNEMGEIFISSSTDFEYTDSLFFQVYAAKYSANYELEWESNVGGKNQNDLHETGIITNDGGMLVSGWFFDLNTVKVQSLIVKVDCQGKLEWDYQSCILPTSPEMKLFPNPFTSQFTIHLPDIGLEDKAELKLFSMSGQFVYEQTNVGERVIRLSELDLAPGMYILHVTINDNQNLVEKVICY